MEREDLMDIMTSYGQIIKYVILKPVGDIPLYDLLKRIQYQNVTFYNVAIWQNRI